MAIDETTPLMKQFNEIKAQAGDALLFFRMGDFYELFGEDAIEAARILEITLTSRDKNRPNPTPMAGVPHHSVQGYIQRLLKAGKKVAIGEQMEDPAKVAGKQIVKRELVRIFTPGVQFDVEGAEANYLAMLMPVTGSDHWTLACLDASTGEALISKPLTSAALSGELAGLPVRHLLRFESDALDAALPPGSLASGILIEKLPSNYLSIPQAHELLKSHYEVAGLDAFLTTDSAIHTLGVLVTYTLRTQKQERLAHLRLPVPLHQPTTMVLGPRTSQHLDLLPSAENGQSLYGLINRTRSALGARQLKRWLVEPLREPGEILARQTAIKELADQPSAMTDKLSSSIAEIYDLERITGRITARLANPRDTLALGRSLVQLPELARMLSKTESPVLRELSGDLIRLSEPLLPLGRKIVETQLDDAPLVSREAGIFRKGAHADLDRLIGLASDGSQWLVELEAREREATGIPSLKVRYNRVFGYYIEITQAHAKNAPAHYQRKQTTVGAERFFTEELKKFEDEIVNSGSKQRALEQELFEALLNEIRAQTAPIMEAARTLGALDSCVSLARLAQEPGWCFPVIDSSLDMEIRQGRHPLVDQPLGASRGAFVPNDLDLTPAQRLTLVITGPNMGGKSTVMRQTALIVILGQLGAPVPAQSARWGAVSRLYTRIGAHDAIARGQSTFMVEMTELAHILHHADERSLIILDEIGRGTSTYDGISVAWSSLEWICQQIKCRTLFATHYHELTRLAAELPLAANAHMGVEGARAGAGRSASLRFLYLLKEGPAQESFGVHVARIAGLPKPVIERAWSVLEELERHAPHSAQSGSINQLSLFDTASRRAPVEEPAPAVIEAHPAILELEKLDVNEMTPIQALNFVVKLQKMASVGVG